MDDRHGKPGRGRRPAQPRRAGPPRREENAGESRGEGDAERIARRLARAGISSRRDAEALIAAGRVSVNGKVLSSPAVNVGPSDRIEVDGTAIPAIERTRLFLFHKPAGVVTTNRDPQGRRTVFDVLPPGLPRLMTIGRLDINTEGLLLLTNDGGLARVLELPSTGWLRRYRVRVHGKVAPEALAALREGIAVGGVFYGAVEAALDREQGSNAWLTLGLREGKNREVKNILGALGLDVTRLIRVSYGPFQLGELDEGGILELKGRHLRDQLGERLIAEAGADFEAPVVTAFSNKPVREKRPPQPQSPAAPPRRERPAPRVEAGGLVRNRRREREAKREEALGRLSTAKPSDARRKRRQEGGRQEGGRQERGRDERPPEPSRPRTANVWMAPGARPQGRRKAEAAAAKPDAGDRPRRGPPGAGPARSGPPRSGKPPRSGQPQRPGKPPRSGRPPRKPPGKG